MTRGLRWVGILVGVLGVIGLLAYMARIDPR